MKTYTITLTEEQRRATVQALASTTIKGASAKAFVALMDLFAAAQPDPDPQPQPSAE